MDLGNARVYPAQASLADVYMKAISNHISKLYVLHIPGCEPEFCVPLCQFIQETDVDNPI